MNGSMETKVYLAIETYEHFRHGSFNEVLGVYSTREKAQEALRNSYYFIEGSKVVNGGYVIPQGSHIVYLMVQEFILDKLPEVWYEYGR